MLVCPQVSVHRGVLTAQPLQAAGVITAIVTDSALIPVSGARVNIAGTAVQVITGANGRFIINPAAPGHYRFSIQKLGFHTLQVDEDVESDDTLRLAFVLDKASALLAGVSVVGKRSPKLTQFDQRRERGGGQFLTAEDIERRNTPFATELIRTLKGVNVKPYPAGGGQVQYLAMNSRSGTTDEYRLRVRSSLQEQTVIGCPMQVYIDGVAMPTPFNLDHLPPPSILAGVEFYSGPATTPSQFGGSDRRCGVIIVWTKDG